jgi:hypothetical protein
VCVRSPYSQLCQLGATGGGASEEDPTIDRGLQCLRWLCG